MHSSFLGRRSQIGQTFFKHQRGNNRYVALTELGHRQPPIPVHCDNIPASGVVNDTAEENKDHVTNKEFQLQWQPGKENLPDYFTKHFNKTSTDNAHIYVHKQNSPGEPPYTVAPKTL